MLFGQLGLQQEVFEIFEELLFDEAEFELSNEAHSELGFDEVESLKGSAPKSALEITVTENTLSPAESAGLASVHLPVATGDHTTSANNKHRAVSPGSSLQEPSQILQVCVLVIQLC